MDQKFESGFFGSLRSHVKKTITDPSTLNKEEERAPAHGNRGGCPIITDNQISDHLFYNGQLLHSYSRILKYKTPKNRYGHWFIYCLVPLIDWPIENTAYSSYSLVLYVKKKQAKITDDFTGLKFGSIGNIGR